MVKLSKDWKRKGFWRDKNGVVYLGYMKEDYTHHYGYFNKYGNLICDREHALLPINDMLKPIPFDEGAHLIAKSFAEEQSKLKNRIQELDEQVIYLLKRESPTIIQLGEHVNMLNQELKLKEDMIHKLILELDKERKKHV